MNNESLVQLALDTLSCRQKELAMQLGVSPTQISKWKKGDYMSLDMQEKLRALANIGDMEPIFVHWAGSVEQAQKWQRLIFHLAEIAHETEETGYNTIPLQEKDDLCWQTICVLNNLGVQKPVTFPPDLEFDYDEIANEDSAKQDWMRLEDNPYSALIYAIYISLNNVYGFYAAYIHSLLDDNAPEVMEAEACAIESELMALAACKIEIDEQFAPNFIKFKTDTLSNYKKWLTLVKDHAFRSGIPLRAELMDLVNCGSDELGHDAEAESLGVNASRIHPDIYMNELLEGMRIIHQVLPVIMDKLGINDFELDERQLRLR